MQRTIEPVAFEWAPEVNEFLASLGLGTLDSDVTSCLGRNGNWMGTTSSGAAVFVKRVVGEPEEAVQRIRRSLAFEAAVRRKDDPGLRTPRTLGHDYRRRLVVTELLPHASTGAERAEDCTFSGRLAHMAGRAIGLLHECPTDGLGPLSTPRRRPCPTAA